MLHLLGEFEKQIGNHRIVIAAGIDAGDNIRKNVTAFSRQLVSVIGLFYIYLQKIVAKNLTGKCRLDIPNSKFGEIRFFSCGVDHHVDMGMIALVMVGSVPAQIGQRDFHVLGNGFCLRAQEVSPCVGVVITKPGGVFTAQRNNVRPHIAFVIRNFLCDFGKVDRNIRVCK